VAMTGNGLRLSAVICTHNRPDALRRALASLTAQDRAPDELLVIDNAPSDESARRLVAHDVPTACYVREPVAGLDFARNRALREASGDVVAFLDDDAVADRGWTNALVQAFAQESKVGVVTGRVEPLALETEAQRLFHANGGFARGRERICLPDDAARPLHGRRAPLIAWAVSVGSGCSLAIRRPLALALGGFDPALDLGPALPGGGDHDMLWRVLEAGQRVVYDPGVLAWHDDRRELRDLAEQLGGHQRALVALLTKLAARTPGRRRLPVLAFLAWRLLKPGVRLARRTAGLDPLPARVLLRMWASCWQGLIAYPASQRLARRRQEARP